MIVIVPPLTLTLAKTQPFRGRVVDQGNDPIPGARVKLDSWNGSHLLQWQALTDEKGSFVWDSPPDGSVMFYVSATNHSSMRTSFSTSSGEHLFNLRKMSRVIGKAIDVDTKKPIDEFVVITGRSYNPEEPIRWERSDNAGGRKGEYSVRLTDPRAHRCRRGTARRDRRARRPSAASRRAPCSATRSRCSFLRRPNGQ